MRMFYLFGVAGALVLANALSGVFAEDLSATRKIAIESFAGARDQRSKLLTEIPRLKEAIDELQRRKVNALKLQDDKRHAEQEIRQTEQNLQRAKENLQAASPAAQEGAQARVGDFETRLDLAKSYLASTEQSLLDEGQDLKKIDEELGKKREDLAQQQVSLETAEHRINELLNSELPRQRFKLYMSGVFAFLVACVIGGFFLIAMKDERVRQAIFSGTSGIQFVTLFSVVIAIILFGIIEVLEGKELAALLGGLSGYILGRATSERASSQPAQPAGGDQNIHPASQPQPPAQSQPAPPASFG